MPTGIKQVYKCNICGNIVEVLHTGIGTLVCCNEPMKKLKEKHSGEGKNKHIPIIKKSGNRITVTIGKVKHPMDKNHYIEWIELLVDNSIIFRKTLLPGNEPEAEFTLKAINIEVRAYCNLHGLWKTELKE